MFKVGYGKGFRKGFYTEAGKSEAEGEWDGMGGVDLQPAIIVVPAFEPVVAGTGVGEEDLADAFEIFDAVFGGDDKAEGGAVASGEGLAIHFVGEDRLRVEGTGCVDADIILVVGSTEADVIERGFGLEVVMLNEVTEPDAAPPGDLAPPFDAFEFEDDLGFGQLAKIVDADGEVGVVFFGDLQVPFSRVKAVCGEADIAVVADVACGRGHGEGGDEVVGGKDVFEDFVVYIEALAEGALDAIARGGVFDPEPCFPCSGAEDKKACEGNEGPAVDLLLDRQGWVAAYGLAEAVA